MRTDQEISEDIIALVTLRLFAKYKKNMMPQSDFEFVRTLGTENLLSVVSTKDRSKDLEEMMEEEIRKALELISRKTCGKCKATGIVSKQGVRYVVCRCVHMVHYRGDDVLPLGDQYSNKYFTDDLSKDSLGKRDDVQNIASGVAVFLKGALGGF